MRAAEAFWRDNDAAFQEALDKRIPGCIDPRAVIARATEKSGRTREGFGVREAPIIEFEKSLGPYLWAWKVSMEAETVATEAANRATEALGKLDVAAKKFREVAKNDLSSMKAISDRVQNEVTQMGARYQAAAALLISPEFERALVNAERMATALAAIQQLAETKVSVAIFGPKKE